MIENRWFTKEGKKKRVGVEFQPFADFAYHVKGPMLEGKVANVAIEAAARYNLQIPDAQVFAIYFIGIYDNGKVHGAFTLENYVFGRKVGAQIAAREGK